MKFPLPFFSFFLFLLCCGEFATKVAPAEQAKNCMTQAIASDDSLGKVRNRACEAISLSETIRQYADGMEKISYQNCPAAFTAAFKRHREAWLALLPVTDQHPDLRGEMHNLFKQLEAGEHAEQFKPLVKTVWDTWAEVEAAMK
jgi:hypothetical protein